MTHGIIVPDHMRGLVDGGRYAPAVRVGDDVHISGQVGREADMVAVTSSLEDHITAAFENLRAVVEAAGGTCADIYELTTYHVDLAEQMPTFAAVKARYFSDPATLPAWTAVGVAALNSPDFLVEIAARAHVPARN
ncbi:RidA family protein [Microbacterium sp. CPCC 204701]|uniref:RidA family protein n=1 Tax=Microbacterium sp. CPCC 204701 TaxID=2493084 RepID=UPI000FD70B2E|nr:RidA family protein [Microbacterium sp. CPCC 204701]